MSSASKGLGSWPGGGKRPAGTRTPSGPRSSPGERWGRRPCGGRHLDPGGRGLGPGGPRRARRRPRRAVARPGRITTLLPTPARSTGRDAARSRLRPAHHGRGTLSRDPMAARLAGLLAVDPSDWLIDTDQVRSSNLILLTLAALGLVAGALLWLGVIDWLLSVAGVLIRGGIR